MRAWLNQRKKDCFWNWDQSVWLCLPLNDLWVSHPKDSLAGFWNLMSLNLLFHCQEWFPVFFLCSFYIFLNLVLMYMTHDLSCWKLSTCLLLCMFVLNTLVFNDTFIYISLLPESILFSIHKISMNTSLGTQQNVLYCKLIRWSFLIWCHGTKKIVKSPVSALFKLWHPKFWTVEGSHFIHFVCQFVACLSGSFIAYQSGYCLSSLLQSAIIIPIVEWWLSCNLLSRKLYLHLHYYQSISLVFACWISCLLSSVCFIDGGMMMILFSLCWCRESIQKIEPGPSCSSACFCSFWVW